jgi:hypothetical protein
MVRAKFICSNIHHVQMSDPKEVCAQVSFMPVYNNAPENASWSKWTPGGLIQMTITNPTAIERFELGKAYFVDFTSAD